MILAVVSSLIQLVFIIYIVAFIIASFLTICAKLAIEPVRRVCTSTVKLDGKVAIVTGGNQGIGLETARDLASRGAHVIIACRNAARAEEAINDIAATTGNRKVEYKPLDLSKFSSVRKFAEDFNKCFDRLDILVHNAGCFDPIITEDGIDMAIQVNYLGPFLLTNLLRDKLMASTPSRIVIVSSYLHYYAYAFRVENLDRPGFTGPIGKFVSYGNSKLCQILWMNALVKRLPEGVTVNTLHPGVIKTDIINDALPFFAKPVIHLTFGAFIYRTAKEGAQTTVHLCVAEEVQNVSGKYFMECKEAECSRWANDDELVEQVWDKSVKLTSSS